MTSTSGGGWDFGPSAARPAGALSEDTPAVESPAVVTGSPAGGIKRPKTVGDRVRTSIRGVGETLITVGLVLLLFVVYEVWVSNIFANRKQDEVHKQFTQAIAQGLDPLRGEDRLNLPSGKQVVIPAGQGFANLYIPRFGKDYAKTIVEGTNLSDLDRGPGHYIKSAVPGQVGNFAIAGHRVGKGEPFLNLDQLRPGDAIIVQTASNWYVYKVLGDTAKAAAAAKISNSAQRDDAMEAALAVPDKQGVVGREIVNPSATRVIAPIPDDPGAAPTRALLTLTTCHPKYSANQRMIIHAALARSVPVKGNATPKELPGGTL